jgi:beta-lactamase class A
MTTRTRIHIAAAAACLYALAAFAPAHAQHDHNHDHDHQHAEKPSPADALTAAETPDTPAGHALRWIIDALRAGRIDTAGRFSDDFLEAVTENRLRTVLMGLASGSEGYVLIRVDETDPHNLVGVARARSDGSAWRILLSTETEEPHRINGLLFQPAPRELVGTLTGWDDADDAMHALDAESVSLYVARVGDDGELHAVHALNENEHLAIGSAFKLWILGALAEKIRNAEASWDEPLAIDEDFKSLPSGVMQDLPHGATAPLAEYALKMISISDNTATDHLLRRVGRDNAHAWMTLRTKAHERNTPFLATREFFTIKLSMDGELLDRYADADAPTRARMLNDEVYFGQPSPLLIQAWTKPQRIDEVEWFASAAELARTLAELRTIGQSDDMRPLAEALTTNPGVPFDDEHWQRAWFKGGSEPGVLNLTWIAERNDGETFAVVLTANDTKQPINEAMAVGAAQRIFEHLQSID